MNRTLIYFMSLLLLILPTSVQTFAQDDGRLNHSLEIAVYCVPPGSVTVWTIGLDGKGEFSLEVTAPQIAYALVQARDTGQNVQVKNGLNGASLWALNSWELQAVFRQAGRPEYDFIFHADQCGTVDVTNIDPTQFTITDNSTTTTGEAVPADTAAVVSGGASGTLGEGDVYIVQPADTVYRISVRFGVTVDTIVAANNLVDPRVIYPGDRLLIPGAKIDNGVTVAVAQPETSTQEDAPPVTENQTTVSSEPPPPVVTAGGGITIWEYHYSDFVLSGSIRMRPEWFAEQMGWLRDNGYHAVTSQELAGYVAGTNSLPERSIVLTFDLGTSERTNFESIVSVLQENGLHGIFFIVTGIISDDCHGDTHCWEALKRWQASGVVSYGSHSVSHPRFADLNSSQILQELRESKRILEAQLGTVYGFAYPFENVPGGMDTLLRQTGYVYAMGGWSRGDFAVYQGDSLWYNLPRLLPYSNDWIYPALTSRANGRTFVQTVSAYTP